MKKGLVCLLLFCVSSFNIASAGFLYEGTTTPLIATDMSVKDIKDLKCGECQIVHCFGIIDIGNAGIQTAMKNANITRIHHVDVETKTIIGIGTSTIRVYGE